MCALPNLAIPPLSSNRKSQIFCTIFSFCFCDCCLILLRPDRDIFLIPRSASSNQRDSVLSSTAMSWSWSYVLSTWGLLADLLRWTFPQTQCPIPSVSKNDNIIRNWGTKMFTYIMTYYIQIILFGTFVITWHKEEEKIKFASSYNNLNWNQWNG